uniref:Alanine--glyoxylate aminotransferase n=1 Tax=Caenorhabditis japonica TaxID=281687 RepID=A0A8R1HQN8_CAEJA
MISSTKILRHSVAVCGFGTLSAMSSRAPPKALFQEMVVPPRQLFGPGPSNMADSIAQTQSKSLLGHLHPEFVQIMSDVRLGLQYVFKTNNSYTFAVSGTGHSGMECAMVNLLEPGDRFLVVEIGLWGQRAADLANRMGIEVKKIVAPHGQAVPVEDIRKAIAEYKPNLVFVCQGDSSTGVAQPLETIGDACREHGALFLVDTVASLGGTPFAADDLKVDCVYSATQKVLNAPPGLAPISFSDRAIQKIRNRKQRVASFYFDALELGNYWGCDGELKRYHHTAPISTVYALRAALSAIAKEGIDESIQRHKDNAQVLYAALKKHGLEPFVENEKLRLPCLTTVKVPEGVDWKEVAGKMLQNGVEIAGGLGATVGKIWRVGTFGLNSDKSKIEKVVELLSTSIGNRK